MDVSRKMGVKLKVSPWFITCLIYTKSQALNFTLKRPDGEIRSKRMWTKLRSRHFVEVCARLRHTVPEIPQISYYYNTNNTYNNNNDRKDKTDLIAY